MGIGTPIWELEGVAVNSTGDMVADSVAHRLAAVQTLVEALPAGADIALQATLEDVEAEVEEVEQHVHTVERWWGALAAPDETNAIEANVDRPFTATSGNDAWGAAIPIKGSADNPVLAGMTTFDPHRLIVTDLDDDTTPWRVRIIYGTGTSADAITAGQWSEMMVITNAVPGNRAGGVPVEVRMPRCAIATKLWVQAWNDTLNEVLSFFWGAHGYPFPPP